MKIYLTPKTKLGKWSVGLIASFFLFMIIFFLLVNSGQRGGKTFFSNPILTIPIVLAGLSGIASFFTGILSIIKYKEKAVVVFLSTIVGLFVLFWTLTEILYPH